MRLNNNISKGHLSKINRQNEAIKIWVENKGVGIFNHCPRFGKLYEGVEIIKRYLKKNVNGNILVLVPNDIVSQQWKELLNTTLGLHHSVVVITLHVFTQTYYKVLSQKYDLSIIDEIHRFVSGNTSIMIESLGQISKFKLGLLGVLPDKEGIAKIERFAPIIDTITEKEAINKEWIAKYQDYNVGLELIESDRIKYAEYSVHLKDLLVQFKNQKDSFKVKGVSVFESDLDLILSCYTGKKILGEYASSANIRNIIAQLNGWHNNLNPNDDIEKEIDLKWNPMILYERCKNFKEVMDKRNEILINNKVKLEEVIKIMSLNPVPTIIFNESVDFVEIVNSKLNNLGIASIAYHSYIKSQPLINPQTGQYYKMKTRDEVKTFGKKKIKEYAIEGLKAGFFKALVTVRALDEGFTCETIEQVITTAGGTNPVNYSQRVARGNTLNPFKPDKITKVINLYFDDFILPDGYKVYSRDKAKLKQRQKYTKSVTWVKNIDEIFAK